MRHARARQRAHIFNLLGLLGAFSDDIRDIRDDFAT